jgi:hypothetical protein
MSDEPIIAVNATVAGDFGKTADTFIKKAFEALNWILEPTQMRRIAAARADVTVSDAKAKAEADRIALESQIELGERQKEVLSRWYNTEERNQSNIERILTKSIHLLEPTATPESIENDWLANLFEKVKTVSNAQMQELWARLLAGEASGPGTFSKHTVNLLADLDPIDARMFSQVCDFGWLLKGDDLSRMKGVNSELTENLQLVPMILNYKNTTYEKHGLRYVSLNHLSNLGLIHFEDWSQYWWSRTYDTQIASYHDKAVEIRFKKKTYQVGRKDEAYGFPIGNVLLTRAGYELSTVCKTHCVPGFFEFVREKQWEARSDDWTYKIVDSDRLS